MLGTYPEIFFGGEPFYSSMSKYCNNKYILDLLEFIFKYRVRGVGFFFFFFLERLWLLLWVRPWLINNLKYDILMNRPLEKMQL